MLLTRHFVFVHMRKTGGSFVRTVLRQNAPTDWDLRELPYHTIAAATPASHAHLPKAGCVRNPFAWYVSWYHYYMRRVREGSIDERHHFWNASAGGSRSFGDSIRALVDAEVKTRGASVGPYTMHLEEMFGPGCSLVELLRTEAIADELIAFLRSHDIAVPDPVAHALRHRPPVNKSRHGHYSTYFDDDLRTLVETLEAPVLEHFGYRFETETDGGRGSGRTGA